MHVDIYIDRNMSNIVYILHAYIDIYTYIYR